MEIRKAELRDLDALLANRMDFIHLVRGDEFTIPEKFKEGTYDFMKKHMGDNSLVVWIAVEQERIVALSMVCYYQLLPTTSNQSGNTGYIQNVFTHPDYRRKGLASQLLEKLMADAKERNVGRLLLSASDMGRPVYEKLGFEMVTGQMIYTIK